MASSKHTHSIHIDAPVKKVFHYLEDPGHLIAGMEEASDGTPPTVVAVHRTPEGVVTSYECKYRELGMHLTATITREEYVDNERIVERSSMGVVWTCSFEPDDTGTTLTVVWDASKLMKMLDAVFFHGDKDMDIALATFKREVEALA
jgi:Polyketide cyclase / dehydrase and lipid transport